MRWARATPSGATFRPPNPNPHSLLLPCPLPTGTRLKLLADGRHANPSGIPEHADGPLRTPGALRLPALSAALWEIVAD